MGRPIDQTILGLQRLGKQVADRCGSDGLTIDQAIAEIASNAVQPRFSGRTLQTLETLLKPVLKAPVECDGATSLISHWLTQSGVVHKPTRGLVHIPGWGGLSPHFWVELMDDQNQPWIIDYRLRMWVGEYYRGGRVPHGIFRSEQSELFPQYQGYAVPMSRLHPEMVKVLLGEI